MRIQHTFFTTLLACSGGILKLFTRAVRADVIYASLPKNHSLRSIDCCARGPFFLISSYCYAGDRILH